MIAIGFVLVSKAQLSGAKFYEGNVGNISKFCVSASVLLRKGVGCLKVDKSSTLVPAHGHFYTVFDQHTAADSSLYKRPGESHLALDGKKTAAHEI